MVNECGKYTWASWHRVSGGWKRDICERCTPLQIDHCYNTVPIQFPTGEKLDGVKTWKSARIKFNWKLIVYMTLTGFRLFFIPTVYGSVSCRVKFKSYFWVSTRNSHYTYTLYNIIICRNIGSTVCIVFVNDFILYYYYFHIFFSDVWEGGVMLPTFAYIS